jgi:hypothetical protein
MTAARVWLPLTISLALHALFGLAVVLLSSPEGVHAEGPIRADAVVLAENDGLITLDDPSPPGKNRSRAADPAPPAGSAETEEAFKATVGEAPVMAATPAASAEPGPAITGDHSGGSGASGVRATGLLRPPAKARTVVYVIDRSLSMGLSGALAVAKRELLAGLDALPADRRFAVVLYNRQAEPLGAGGRSGLLDATEANRTAVARLAEGVRAEGGTDHLAALRRAVALGADVIFLVTDADELTAEQARNVALLNRGRAVIHAIELNNDGASPDETPLALLARLTGGTHRVVPVK